MQDKLQQGISSGVLTGLVRRGAGYGMRLFIRVVACAMLLPPGVLADNVSLQYEHKVKVAYLYNFTKFTRWPLRQAEEQEDVTFNVCILGQDPISEEAATLNGKLTGRARVAVKTLRVIPRQDDCQVLFISRSEASRLSDVLQAVEGQPVLTVSDLEGFAEAGGCIELVTFKGRVVFNINMQAAQRAQLKLSAQLLELAKVVVEK